METKRPAADRTVTASSGGAQGAWTPPEEVERLSPLVEQALAVSARRDRRVLSAALAPVMGGALRRASLNVFTRALARLNRFFVLTFSSDGLRWHFEALRTGRSFAAVVRDHSLVEPVTQVFLIHRATGLLLQQVMQPAVQGQDGDMVSGMLTAIQDFVHDSFKVREAGRLEVIRVGDVSVLIEQGEHAILAGIISQGFEPKPLREVFRRALRRIQAEFGDELVRFSGDGDRFDGARPLLEGCLRQSMIKGEDRISPLTWVLLVAPVLALIVYGGLFFESSVRWRRCVRALEREPGIMVLRVGWQGGQRAIRGLRDPLAVDPADVLLEYGLTADDVRSDWRAYQSLDETLLVQRIRMALAAPPTVEIVLRDGAIALEGSAPVGWKQAVECRLFALLGYSEVRMDGLREDGLEEHQAWTRYVDRLRRTPGLVVLTQEHKNGRYTVMGLRDPLAPDPDDLLPAEGPPLARVERHWIAYQALTPELVLVRARRVLAPPAGVTITLDAGVLRLAGDASNAWVRQAQFLARGLAGIDYVDTLALEDSDLRALRGMIPALEQTVFYFLADRQNLWPGQERRYSDFVEAVRRFNRMARRLGAGYGIEIRGHVPASGDPETARQASMAIAERFYERLQQAGLDMEPFSRRAMGDQPALVVPVNDGRRRESHISFHVLTSE
jgi:hypothetical protein